MPPTHLGGRDTFFIKTFDRPGVDEFVHFFWLVGNLRVAFADVNYACAGQHRQSIELLVGQSRLDCALTLARATVTQNFVRDFEQRLFCKVRNQARVRAVFNDGTWSFV